MGFLDTVRAALRGNGMGMAAFVDQRGLFEEYVLGLSPEDLYRTQPHLRTVISFLARNVAHLGLHCFARLSDTDRERVKDDPVAELLSEPNDAMTTYDLIYRLVADWALYDEALWVFEEDLSRDSGWRLEAIPPSWIMKFGGGSVFGADWVEIKPPTSPRAIRIPRANYMHFHGWDPSTLTKGSSPVAALKATLQEQIHAVKYRDQLWTRAGRVGITVTRPTPEKGGAKWTVDQKKAFKRVLDSKLSGDSGSEAGGSIILEDGMTMDRMRFTAHEEEFVEGAKLALSTVAQVYHVNPTMIGLLDNANFSNVREFNRSLYTNTLGPILAQIQHAINRFLVPRVAARDGLYVEFNIQEKLSGSFEEQAAVVSAATGRPWQTVNEARARFNLSAIEGGDELSIPLNVVLAGGSQASPADSAPPKAAPFVDLGELSPAQLKAVAASLPPEALPKGEPAGRSYKARANSNYEKNIARLLRNHYSRQRKAVLSAIGAGDPSDWTTWYDFERWNSELGDDLYKAAVQTASSTGREAAEALGFDPKDYDEERTLAYLRAVADARAEHINTSTYKALEKVLNEETDRTLAEVFDYAEAVRAENGASSLVTTFSSMGTAEAGEQLGGEKVKKKWVVTSKDPRPEHAKMNGETVAIGKKFSNGAEWPGDPALGPDGVSNCKCSIEITLS